MTPPRLDSLPPSTQRTFIMILQYLYDPQTMERRRSLCFTYQGLRSWIHYGLPREERPEWHTVERALRRLAEMEVLQRIRKGKRVVFCPGRYWSEFVAQYARRLRQAQLPPDSPYRSLLEYLG